MPALLMLGTFSATSLLASSALSAWSQNPKLDCLSIGTTTKFTAHLRAVRKACQRSRFLAVPRERSVSLRFLTFRTFRHCGTHV
jgi:hypothetical protein